MNITSALKGIGGEFEINRVIGAVGGLAYVAGANVFVAWNLIEGRPFDLVAYCAAFPAGLGVVIGAVAGAVAYKDKGVATAKVIQDTGAQPGKAAEGAAA